MNYVTLLHQNFLKQGLQLGLYFMKHLQLDFLMLTFEARLLEPVTLCNQLLWLTLPQNRHCQFKLASATLTLIQVLSFPFINSKF